jgi:hypothetical protein
VLAPLRGERVRLHDRRIAAEALRDLAQLIEPQAHPAAPRLILDFSRGEIAYA